MNTTLIPSQKHIEGQIFTLRDVYVMLDSDLAVIYQTETKFINRAMKRNPDRFPPEFVFQLKPEEWEMLRYQIGTSSEHGGRRTAPYVFTEQGVAMLSAVLQTQVAIQVSIQVINAFVQMRKLISSYSGLLQRMDGIEQKQLKTDQKVEQLFNALEKDTLPHQGVFFEGQVFDAYELTSKIIRSANQHIVLIDNYIDENTLIHLAKKGKGVSVLLCTKNTSKQLMLDVQKANAQYKNFALKTFAKSHDRFLIIDGKEVYHLGASLKDLGKKWFAFSKMNKESVENLMNEINKLV